MGSLRIHRVIAALLVVGPAGAWAEANIRVPQGPVAVWYAAPNLLVVASQKPATVDGDAREVSQFGAQNGVHLLTMQVSNAWALRREGKAWVITEQPTKGKSISPLATGHAVLLQDAWELNETPLIQHTRDVAGKRWQIGLTAAPLRHGAALAGYVDGALSPKFTAPVRENSPQTAVTEAAPAAPRPSKLEQMLVRIEPAAGLPATPQPQVEEQQLSGSVPTETATAIFPSGVGKIYEPGRPQPLPEIVQVLALPPAADEDTSPALPEVVEPSPTLLLTGTQLGPATEASVTEILRDDTAAAHSDGAADGHGNETAHHAGAEAEHASSTEPALELAEISATLAASPSIPPVPLVLLPARGTQWMTDYGTALSALAAAPEGSSLARSATELLAGTYINWNRPEEAEALLRTLPADENGVPRRAEARLMLALTQMLQGEAAAANLFAQPEDLQPVAELWRAVATAMAGRPAAANRDWPEHEDFLRAWPQHLQDLALRTKLEAWLKTGQADKVVAALPEPAQAWQQRLAGLARLGTPDEQQGLDYLGEAAASTTDKATAARAKFEFVVALHQRREISDAQLQSYLNDLQQDWRGDETERQMLTILADLADKTGDPNTALKQWQTLIQSFPNTPDLPALTQRMAQAFVDVFDPENPRQYDPLAYLGLYYDFRELLPNDERGDRVQERMAEALIAATLYARAVPILEQQLQYRPLEPVAQGRLALLLAEAQRQRNQPAESLKVLERWRDRATTQALTRNWAMAEARALLDLQRPKDAAALLKKLQASDKAMNAPADRSITELMADAAWQGQDWAEARTQLETLLAGTPSDVLANNDYAKFHLFRLAFTLGQLGEAEALANLKQRYVEAWPALPELADDLNAVAASTGLTGISPEGGALQALTTAMTQINELDDKVAQIRRQFRQSREEREEYNTRMQYMDLLPPPAL